MKHRPYVLSTGRHGVWIECSCGWRSKPYGGRQGAQLAWCDHVLSRARRRLSKRHVVPETS